MAEVEVVLTRGYMIAAQMAWIHLMQPLKKLMMVPSLMDL